MANKKAVVADEVVARKGSEENPYTEEDALAHIGESFTVPTFIVPPIPLTDLIDIAIEVSQSQTLHSQIAERLNEAKRFIV